MRRGQKNGDRIRLAPLSVRGPTYAQSFVPFVIYRNFLANCTFEKISPRQRSSILVDKKGNQILLLGKGIERSFHFVPRLSIFVSNTTPSVSYRTVSQP